MGESGGETVLYIASLTEEVARLARAHGFDALAYLFDLARLEPAKSPNPWAGTSPARQAPNIDGV